MLSLKLEKKVTTNSIIHDPALPSSFCQQYIFVLSTPICVCALRDKEESQMIICIYWFYCLTCHEILFYSVKNIKPNTQVWISIISLICWANLSDFILSMCWYIRPKNTTDIYSIQKYIVSRFSSVTTLSHYPQNTKNKSRQMHGVLTYNDIY